MADCVFECRCCRAKCLLNLIASMELFEQCHGLRQTACTLYSASRLNAYPPVLQDPNDCFAFELEYAKASGLNNMEGMSPVLQMVFQYSILLPQPQPPAADAASQQQCACSMSLPLQQAASVVLLDNSEHVQLRCHDDNVPVACRCVLQRRMRVLTVPIPLAVTPREVFDGCDPDAVLAVLLHKLIQAAGEVRAAGHVHNHLEAAA